MKVRPKSITIISWYLIIAAGISVISTVLAHNNPELIKMMKLSAMPFFLQYLQMVVGVLIMITSGIFMLKGKGLGRVMYVSWTPISILLSLATSPVRAIMIPGIVFFAVIAFLLFRPKANEYFAVQR